MQAVDRRTAGPLEISESVVWRWGTCPIEKKDALIVDITENHCATFIEKYDSTHLSNVRWANTTKNGQSRTVNYGDRIPEITHKISVAIETDNGRVSSTEDSLTD